MHTECSKSECSFKSVLWIISSVKISPADFPIRFRVSYTVAEKRILARLVKVLASKYSLQYVLRWNTVIFGKLCVGVYEQLLLSSVCCYHVHIFNKYAYHFNICKLHTSHRFSKHTPNSRGGIKTRFLLYFVKVSLQSSDKVQFGYSCISSTVWRNSDVWKCPCSHFYNIN